MAELEEIFKKATQTLEKAFLSYVISGGVTAILHGSQGTTAYIDIIIQNSPNLINKILQAFQSGDFEVDESQLRYAITKGQNTSIFTRNSVIRIDLKVAHSLDEREALQQAVEEKFMGITVRIASVEQNL